MNGFIRCFIVISILSGYATLAREQALGAAASKDGPKVAYIKNKEVYSSALDGTEVKQLTQDGQAKDFLRWSPDGKSLFYVEYTVPDVPNLFVTLVRIDDSGKVMKRIPVIQQSGNEIDNDMRYITEAGWITSKLIYIGGSSNQYESYESFNVESGAIYDSVAGFSWVTGCPARDKLAHLDEDSNTDTVKTLTISDLGDTHRQDRFTFPIPANLLPYGFQWSLDCERLAFRERNSAEKHLPESGMGDDKDTELVILHGGSVEARLLVKAPPNSVAVFSLKDRFGVSVDQDTYFLYDLATKSLIPQKADAGQQWLSAASAYLPSNQGEASSSDVWHPQ